MLFDSLEVYEQCDTHHSYCQALPFKLTLPFRADCENTNFVDAWGQGVVVPDCRREAFQMLANGRRVHLRVPRPSEGACAVEHGGRAP